MGYGNVGDRWVVFEKEEEMKIDYKIEVEIGEFKIMMTLDEVKELRDRLNEICPGSELQFKQGIRSGVAAPFTNDVGQIRDSLARGVPHWPNDPDITMRQGE